MPVALHVDGHEVLLESDAGSLLDALRHQLGISCVKDGCSPQGQCGCCTVLVDGAPRAACVTALRRVAGRRVVTFDGLDPAVRDPIVDALVAAGGSQCGFCTPGIVCRAAALPPAPTRQQAETALLAHLCRCTGWQSILDALVAPSGPDGEGRDLAAASVRAGLEGHASQRIGPEPAAGRAGFADDLAPRDALVAVPDGRGGWAVGDDPASARAHAARVPGRRSGRPVTAPIDVAPGDWALTLATSWVEPGYLEPDASWCEPGGRPASAVANGGAFGAKHPSLAEAAARRLADEHGRAVRVLLSREDVVALGPKRPPVAAGVRADGTGVIRVARTPGIAAVLADAAPGLVVEEVDVAGPPTSASLRGAGWVEAAVLAAGLRAASMGAASGAGTAEVIAPGGGWAEAAVRVDERGRPVSVSVALDGGPVLDEVTLRSYALGAVHMGLSWVCSEGIAVDEDGVPLDLTVRSWGILRARDMPPVDLEVRVGRPEAVNASDAVFAATAAAVWIAQGLPSMWPTCRGAWDR